MKKAIHLIMAISLLGLAQVSLAQAKIVFQTAVNPKLSYADPSKHVLHVVMKAAFAVSALRPAARPGVLKALKEDVSQRSCLTLQASGKEFSYVKTPDGIMEVELHDATGVLLFIQRTAWKSCH